MKKQKKINNKKPAFVYRSREEISESLSKALSSLQGKVKQKESDTLALCVSDLQLDHNCPGARRADFVNWYDVQAMYLKQLKDKAAKHGNAPILIAGDLFDNYNQPSEFTNFLMGVIPHVYAIPGNHDLPNHNYNERFRSVYQTFVEAGRITNIEPYMPFPIGKNLMVYGFPIGFSVVPRKDLLGEKEKGRVNVALAHSYIWKQGCGFEGASEDNTVSQYLGKLRGYDVAVFGDNHRDFLVRKKRITIANCGTFMRRRMDEKDLQPKVVVIKKDGTVTREKLDCSSDRFVKDEVVNAIIDDQIDLSELVTRIAQAGVCVFEYVESMRKHVGSQKIDKVVSDVLELAITKYHNRIRSTRRLQSDQDD